MIQTDINGFILQTALDYDMSYESVEYIYINFKESFYEKLEEYIIQRSK